MHIRSRYTVVLVVLTIIIGLVGPVATAAGPRPLVDGLAGPLSIDVTPKQRVLVGQNFAGVLSKVTRHGVVKDLLQEPGLSAVAKGRGGKIWYTIAGEDGESLLKVRYRDGRTETIADLGAHEEDQNPDRVNTYGFRKLTKACKREFAELEDAGPPRYKGIVESNPYAIAHTRKGLYIADAAGNAILFVDHAGKVSTVAVLPPQTMRVPADFAAENGIPSCTGLKYRFEPVPTDVEVRNGRLYVTTLPGGPEDASLGARGSVYRINPDTGKIKRLGTGFFGATDLAVSRHGAIYVTEVFGNKVSRLTGNGLRTIVELPNPAAVEIRKGRLYIAYDVFESGKIDVVRP